MWPFQPESNNEVFDEDLDVSKGLSGKVSPRQEYMNLAAVPRFSRPSMELQVASTTFRAALYSLGCVLGLSNGGGRLP